MRSYQGYLLHRALVQGLPGQSHDGLAVSGELQAVLIVGIHPHRGDDDVTSLAEPAVGSAHLHQVVLLCHLALGGLGQGELAGNAILRVAVVGQHTDAAVDLHRKVLGLDGAEASLYQGSIQSGIGSVHAVKTGSLGVGLGGGGTAEPGINGGVQHGDDFLSLEHDTADAAVAALGQAVGGLGGSTARSNKVAVVLGFQDFSQLKRDYGDKEAAVIMSTVGNVFSGQVVGETAKTLSERFGKILQKRESMSINRNDTSTSINTQLDSLIPASKISTLSQGMFVGAVADNFGETIEQKIFHAQIVVDNEAVQKETAAYQPIPEISSFLDENGNDTMEQQIQANYRQIKQDIMELVENELIRIENDPALKHLLGGDKGTQAQT